MSVNDAGPPPRAEHDIRTPPFDPELVPILGMVQQAIPIVGLTADSIPRLREAFAHRHSDEELELGGRFTVKEVTVPGGPGSPSVPLVVCSPRTGNAPAPVIYYAHGGGLVAGHNRSNLVDVLELAAAAGAGVVSVEYRLAPDHRYPAALEDCSAGLAWVRAEAGQWGLDASRIVLAGTSGGGGLMAATALVDRDRGSDGVLGQLLMSPMLDNRDTLSAWQMTGLGVWDSDSNATAWAAYLGERASDDVDWYAVPGRARDLGGLPSTFLDVAAAETFREEVLQFAGGLWAAGGDVELHVWAGGFHNFDSMVPAALVSQDAKAARSAWLRRILRRAD